MALIALAADKGSPGVTTAAVALAAVWPRRVMLAETANIAEESETALDEALQRVTDRDLLWYDWSEIKNVPRA